MFAGPQVQQASRKHRSVGARAAIAGRVLLAGFLTLALASCQTQAVGLGVSAATTIPTMGGASISPAELDNFLRYQMEELGIPGLSIVIVGGNEVVYSRAMGEADVAAGRPVEQETLFEAASLSKPLFAYFAMRLVSEKVLDLDMPLYRYLPHPDLSNDPRHRRITARMVLSHTSGLPNWRWENKNKQLDIKFEPGSQFLYSGEGYEYLASVVAHLTGTTLEDLGALVRRHTTDPIGMDRAYWTWNANVAAQVATGYVDGQPKTPWMPTELKAAASLHTSALDYGIFLQAVMMGKGLPPEIWREMLRAQAALPEDHEFFEEFGLEAWSLGFAIKKTRFGTAYTHGGINEGFTSWAAFYPDRQFGYVFFTNSEKAVEFNRELEAFLISGSVSEQGR